MESKLVHQHRYSTRLQSRLMTSNQNPENKGRRSRVELVAEVPNLEQLEREGQAPKTKAEKALMTKEISMLQKGEVIIGDIAVGNADKVVTVTPLKFKVPDFNQYHGTGCPSEHLKMYVRKMAAHAHDDKVLIHFFQNSLIGASLDWYLQLPPSDVHSWRDLFKAFLKHYQHNLGPAPDRSQLQFMSKKDYESFEEYAQRWRSVAAQVKPPLTEREMVSLFMDTLPAVFYKRLIGKGPSSLSDVIRVGARLEVKIKRERVSCNPTDSNNAIGERRKPRQFDSIPMPYTDLFNYLITNKLITTRPMKPIRPPYFRGYNPNSTCAFHGGAVGHVVENCKAFKHVVQDLIDANWISFKPNSPGTTADPLPRHGTPSVNAIEDSGSQIIIKDAENIKTPLEDIYAELCRGGIIQKGCVCADSACAGVCKDFKSVLQDLMDRHVIQIGTYDINGKEEINEEATPVPVKEGRWDTLGEPSGKFDYLVMYDAPESAQVRIEDIQPTGWGEEEEQYGPVAVIDDSSEPKKVVQARFVVAVPGEGIKEVEDR